MLAVYIYNFLKKKKIKYKQNLAKKKVVASHVKCTFQVKYLKHDYCKQGRMIETFYKLYINLC